MTDQTLSFFHVAAASDRGFFSTSQIRSERCFQNCTADVFVTQNGEIKYLKETRSEGQQCGDERMMCTLRLRAVKCRKPFDKHRDDRE